jgi:hypothetical protein
LSTTIIIREIVRCSPPRTCTECGKVVQRRDRLQVRMYEKRGLNFFVGLFCSVRCLLRAAKRARTIRDWTFKEQHP